MEPRRESDLYMPIKALLEEQGFTVKGEVNDCDLVGVRGDDLVVVELKVAFNLALVLQGIDRQRITDAVYVAVEAPRRSRGDRRWTEIQTLCRRLGLGLITVSFAGGRPAATVLFDPVPYQPRPRPKLKGRLLREFQRRSGDHNTGGSTRRPVVTAYREEALRLAACLQGGQTAAVKVLREQTGVKNAASILQMNYYGWFERVTRGVYQLTPAGEQALEKYADVVADQVAASKQD